MDVNYDSDPVAMAEIKPEFLETPGLDRLYTMFVALCEQLAITNERHDTLLRVLAENGHVSVEALERYDPPQDVEQARLAQHQAMIKSVLSEVERELNDLRKK